MSSDGSPPPAVDPGQAEEIRFWQEHRAAGSPSTRSLALAIGSVFALELLWSRGGVVPLTEMGANVPTLVPREPWRLLTCAFLHVDPVHLLMNGAALFAIGTFLERVLGSARFVVIYVVSALAGSLASALLSPRPAVGASGAVWGLMCAQIALTLRPTRFLPDPVRLRVRGMMWPPLALNAVISFLPGVGLWGHVGGGLAGAALVLSGIFEPRAAVAATQAGPLTRAIAAACVLLMAAALAWGWLVYTPWRPLDPMKVLEMSSR